jgi:hypothetical protein
MAADNPPAGSGIDDVFPTWRKNNIRVCPVASPADGGRAGATKAKQEACNALNLGVEFFLLFSHQIRALLSFLFLVSLLLPNFKPV